MYLHCIYTKPVHTHTHTHTQPVQKHTEHSNAYIHMDDMVLVIQGTIMY